MFALARTRACLAVNFSMMTLPASMSAARRARLVGLAASDHSIEVAAGRHLIDFGRSGYLEIDAAFGGPPRYRPASRSS